MDNNTALPKPTALDTVHTVAKAALSLVPYAGGPAAELFGLVIAPPLQKRQKQWMEDLAARVEKLEAKKGITPEPRVSRRRAYRNAGCGSDKQQREARCSSECRREFGSVERTTS